MSPSKKPEPPKASTVVQVSTIAFTAVGIAVFHGLAPVLFPRQPGQGINFVQVAWAALVGGVCAAIGYGVGKGIDRHRK